MLFRKQSEKGSIGHSEALDYLMQQVNTPYTVVLDADAVFLQKGWDISLINKLNEKVKIIGTPPVINPNKPTAFPLMYAVLFETETFKKLQISFKPKKSVIKYFDTGWEMREKYLANGYKGFYFKVKNTHQYKKGPFKELLCVEYYYPNNNLIASHFGRGSTQGRNKYKRGVDQIYLIPIINKIYTHIRGRYEKYLCNNHEYGIIMYGRPFSCFKYDN